MYIKIGTTEYTQIKNLSFAPESDVTGSVIPVNRFVVDITTDDSITVGGDIYLYDDLDQLWAKYWLTDAYQLDEETVRVTAQSLLVILDRITLPAAMYSGAALATVIAEIFAKVSAIYGQTVIYQISTTYNSETITGYAPEQSARDRLQWVLLCIGAMCLQSFTEYLQFVPVSEDTAYVPMNQVAWRPEVGVSDYVTAVTVTSYSYTQGTPESTDDWVEVNGVYYIQTATTITLSNPDVPSTAPENIVKIEGVTLVNSSNVSDILSRLSTYYFMRGEVSAEIIDNKQFLPGQRVIIPVNDDAAYSGFIRSADFTFGVQAKAKIKLAQTEGMNLSKVTVVCRYGTEVIGRQYYAFPVDYVYTIEVAYIEAWSASTHMVYYPYVSEVTGTMTAEDVTVYVDYGLALSQYTGTEVLTIYSVDEATQSTETEDEENVEVLTIG